MEINKTNQTLNVNATSTNGDYVYNYSYSVRSDKVENFNGSILKGQSNIGTFNKNNMMGESNNNYGFKDVVTVEEKATLIEDIDTIYELILQSI
jgi:hypothetical protein